MSSFVVPPSVGTQGSGSEGQTPTLRSQLGTQGSGSEGQTPSLRSTTQQQFLNVINSRNVITNRWSPLNDQFYNLVEKPSSNRLATYIQENKEIKTTMFKNEYPIKIDGTYSSDLIDSFILNSLVHFLTKHLSTLNKECLIDSDIKNLFVPASAEINFLFYPTLPHRVRGQKSQSKDYTNFEKWKRKNNLQQGQAIQIHQQVVKMNGHTQKMNDFLDLIARVDSAKGNVEKPVDIRNELKTINIIHPYDLAYIIIGILSRKFRAEYIPSILKYEILIALQWAITNSTGSKVKLYTLLFNKFIEKFAVTPTEISMEYTQGITNPVIVSTMKTHGKGDISLFPCQVDMIKSINSISDSFVNYLSGDSTEDKIIRSRLAITTGLASGKSTIASLIPTIKVANYNKSKISEEKHGTVLFVIPSHMTAADFAVIADKHGYTWFGRDCVLIPNHASCPQIKTNNKKKPFRPDKFAENGGLDTTLELVEQMKQLVNYEGKSDSYSTSKFHLPTTMFVDPCTAAKILEHSDAWSTRFNIEFLPIVDEVVATGDVSSDENLYIKTIASIINNFDKFGVVISATLTPKQLEDYNIFGENCQVDVVTGGQTCNSFTQMYDLSGRSLQPLQGMKSEDLPSFVKDISSTILRCFPPKVYNCIKEAYDNQSKSTFPDLTWDDISSAELFLNATKRLLEAICDFSLRKPDKAKLICETKVKILPIESKGKTTTMTITTNNPKRHILDILENPITQDRLQQYFLNHENGIKNNIQDLRVRRAEMKQSRVKDTQDGSSKDISEQIAFKEQELKDRSKWVITITSQFGSVTVSTAWFEKYNYLDKRLFALLLCGLELEFPDDVVLDNAMTYLNPRPSHVIDNIAGMYGRNVPTCNLVNIIGTDIGWDSITQAAARAGRELSNNAIVSLYIKSELLNSDPKIKSIMRLMDNLNELRGIQHIPGPTIVPTATTVVHTPMERSEQDEESDEDKESDEVDEDDQDYTGHDVIDYARQVVASQRTFESQEHVIVEGKKDDDHDVPLDWEEEYDRIFDHTSTGECATSCDVNPEKKKRLPGSARRANKNKKKNKQLDRRVPLLVHIT